ncbi:hypothetical protein FHX44_112671 [Pseudonocardia hierapolitana]|uniref:Uncharacterized protein n=1 Tax=Pseudonocardia hierapolitana TaxID=1128676 RepID=A0A561SPK1_9PSEU|nr:hypothetical protein [Pseudonocardia hierapolitana]TWF76776.1 hypothetical protein FHX44_112671 [Pseudonocardia hierapolitana]
MSRVRRPVIAGVTRGSGTSTLAAALHAIDAGLLAPGSAGEADVLVCRSDEQSLRQAATLACAPSGPRPVLVLAGIARGIPIPSLPAGQFAAVAVLPHVRRWFAGDARAEAAAVLAYPPERLPADVRAYAAALHRIVSALVGSGQLQRAVPPLVSRPVTTALWRGLPAAGPLVPQPTRPRDHPVEPDDDALEGEPVAAGAT